MRDSRFSAQMPIDDRQGKVHRTLGAKASSKVGRSVSRQIRQTLAMVKLDKIPQIEGRCDGVLAAGGSATPRSPPRPCGRSRWSPQADVRDRRGRRAPHRGRERHAAGGLRRRCRGHRTLSPRASSRTPRRPWPGSCGAPLELGESRPLIAASMFGVTPCVTMRRRCWTAWLRGAHLAHDRHRRALDGGADRGRLHRGGARRHDEPSCATSSSAAAQRGADQPAAAAGRAACRRSSRWGRSTWSTSGRARTVPADLERGAISTCTMRRRRYMRTTPEESAKLGEQSARASSSAATALRSRCSSSRRDLDDRHAGRAVLRPRGRRACSRPCGRSRAQRGADRARRATSTTRPSRRRWSPSCTAISAVRVKRAEGLARLQATIASGRAVIGAGAGTGLSAKCAEAGGGDLIIIYNSGRYRMAGRGSLWVMPYGDANAIVVDMARGGAARRRRCRCWPGVCGTDRSADGRLHGRAVRIGFSGVQNFPTVGLLDGLFRINLEETGMGYDLEVDAIRIARERTCSRRPTSSTSRAPWR